MQDSWAKSLAMKGFRMVMANLFDIVGSQFVLSIRFVAFEEFIEDYVGNGSV